MVVESLLMAVLLFQPMRQTMERAEATIKRADVTTFLKPLLEVVRNLAGVSELVALIVSGQFTCVFAAVSRD